MAKLKAWCEQRLADPEFESNGELGKAMQYLINHYEGLVLFCLVPGASIDSNFME